MLLHYVLLTEYTRAIARKLVFVSSAPWRGSGAPVTSPLLLLIRPRLMTMQRGFTTNENAKKHD